MYFASADSLKTVKSVFCLDNYNNSWFCFYYYYPIICYLFKTKISPNRQIHRLRPVAAKDRRGGSTLGFFNNENVYSGGGGGVVVEKAAQLCGNT